MTAGGAAADGIARRFDQSREVLAEELLGVSIELETVHDGVRGVLANGVLGVAQIGCAERGEDFFLQGDAHGGERAEKAGEDLGGHLQQALGGIVERGRLVFVLVLRAEIDLTDAFDRDIAVHFGERPDFEAPIAGDAVGASQVGGDGEFAGEGIAKAFEEVQKAVGAEGADEARSSGVTRSRVTRP